MMQFDDAFIERLKENPVEYAREACRTVISHFESSRVWDESDFLELAEVTTLLEELVNTQLIALDAEVPSFKGDQLPAHDILMRFVQNANAELDEQSTRSKLQSIRARFSQALGNSFSYEFSSGDIEKIQVTINELRQLVTDSTVFYPQHQQRLLRRLEKLQAEMHKKVSDLDRFWGFVGDAGVVAGKFGNDAKPIVDRITEIVGIVWRTQARAEELPSNAPMPILGKAEAPGNPTQNK